MRRAVCTNSARPADIPDLLRPSPRGGKDVRLPTYHLPQPSQVQGWADVVKASRGRLRPSPLPFFGSWIAGGDGGHVAVPFRGPPVRLSRSGKQRIQLPCGMSGIKFTGTDGGTRTRIAKAEGFSYQLRLSPPPLGVCGLDYTFTLANALGAARLVSTPSRSLGLGSGSPSDRVPRI